MNPKMMRQKVKLKPGQESVWDYPRPPKLEFSVKHVRAELAGLELFSSGRAMRILETSHPPVYYIPQGDITMEVLTPNSKQTFCEFKGAASYWDIQINSLVVRNAAWSYSKPTAGFEDIKDYLAFYPSKLDACYLNDELIKAQEGDFYGGWISSDVVGPFKGAAGTWGW